MIDETPFPNSEADNRMDDTGEPYTGDTSPPFETKIVQPPFATIKIKGPSIVDKTINVTLRLTPYAITLWIFAPEDLKYSVRKNLRYLPWAVRYAIWWLKQSA